MGAPPSKRLEQAPILEGMWMDGWRGCYDAVVYAVSTLPCSAPGPMPHAPLLLAPGFLATGSWAAGCCSQVPNSWKMGNTGPAEDANGRFCMLSQPGTPDLELGLASAALVSASLAGTVCLPSQAASWAS